MQKFLVLLCMLCSIVNFSFGQTQTPVYFSSSIAGANSKGLYQYLPAGYSTGAKKYSLIIWTHGAGQVGQGNTTDLPKVLLYGLPNVISTGAFPATFTVGDSTFSFIVISPQFMSNPTGLNMAGILAYALNNYRVDTDRIYMLGMSAGGGGVWDYASTSKANSLNLAAIIPFAGNMGPNQTQANNIASANLPVWAFHNTNDGTVPVSYSRNWKSFINAYVPAVNPAAILTEFNVVSADPIVAHDCWTATTKPTYKPNGINIYEWLLGYKKRPVVNVLPTAKAGDDAAIVLPNNLTLNGAGSTDSDGTIVSYRWRKVSGPEAYKFADSTIANAVVQNLVAGIYGFELTVTDNRGGSATDNVLINAAATLPAGSERRVLIDAGPANAAGGVITPSPTNGYYWNNMTDARVGVQLSATKTTTNLATTIGIQVINRIDGTYNTTSNGMNNVNSSPVVGIYPTSATNDYAFAHNSTTTGQWKITGLEADKLYTIKFWGTKSGETKDRDIEIKRTDETTWKTYSAASNTNFDNAAFFSVTGVTSVDFNIRAKAGSIFGYINVIDITWNSASTNQAPTTTNQAPVARAGADQKITLPTDSTTLLGCTSSDPENAALKFKWRKLTGAAPAYIVNDTLCSAKIKGLAAGNYTFELMVTDTGSVGLTATDDVQVTVIAGAVTTKSLKVNLFDGTFPYTNTQWNNWNPVSAVNSSTFKYTDGTQSSIFVNLSSHPRFADNGLGYGAGSTICPPEVLRFNSMHAVNRTFTVSGLNTAKQYSFEFYGSRGFTSGSKSIFSTGNVADTIDTDFNVADFAKLNNITPDNTGKIVFTLSFIGTYNYLAGFTVTEAATVSALAFGRSAVDTAKAVSAAMPQDNNSKFTIYPNPFADKIMVRLNDKKTRAYTIYITDMAGNIRWKQSSTKTTGVVTETIQPTNLKSGIYFLHIVSSDEKSMFKLIRQ